MITKIKKGNATSNNIAQNKTNVSTQKNSTLKKGKELVVGYFYALEFFRDIEKRQQSNASWYFNYMRENEYKACRCLDRAELARKNGNHYLDLIIMAYKKNPALISKVREVTND